MPSAGRGGRSGSRAVATSRADGLCDVARRVVETDAMATRGRRPVRLRSGQPSPPPSGCGSPRELRNRNISAKGGVGGDNSSWKKRFLPQTPSFPRTFTMGGSGRGAGPGGRPATGGALSCWPASSTAAANGKVFGRGSGGNRSPQERFPPALLFTSLKCYVESACRTGGPERHDRVLFPPCLTEPKRAERRRRRRRPRRLPGRSPCSGARAFPPQNAEGGQDDACRRPQPHGAAASRHSDHQGHPPVIAGRGACAGESGGPLAPWAEKAGGHEAGGTWPVDGCVTGGCQGGGGWVGRTLLLRVSIVGRLECHVVEADHVAGLRLRVRAGDLQGQPVLARGELSGAE